MWKHSRFIIFWLVALCVITLAGNRAWAATSWPVTSRKACSRRASEGWARCHALITTDSSQRPITSLAPSGYGPSDFRLAYGTGSASTSLAVVVAYDAPNIRADLAAYSRAFGLPELPDCSSGSQLACFKKLSQRGTAAYPTPDTGWAVEASMDVEVAHGMCPACRLTLVEADSAAMDDLATAVDQAAAQGAKIISNSYGGPEFPTENSLDAHYNRSGVVMVVSSGDSGYGTTFPAASSRVVAVGGTDLYLANGRLQKETAWLEAGSGCSKYETKPPWQHDLKCSHRSIADVAADADPATGAAVLDSYPANGRKGWFKVGGTSLAAPLVAGILASSGKTANQPAWLYSTTHSIRDITSGHNGKCLTYLCTAQAGYDGPTGVGTLRL